MERAEVVLARVSVALRPDRLVARGAGVTLLTFTAETWSTPPEAADLLVVVDGAQLSVNAVVILEDIEFDGSTDIASAGFINGQFVAAAVKRRDYFVQSENQVLQMVEID